MGFYIRKSVSAGPFRFNLSTSGVGMSVGVRGLRIGTGPRGHYIRAGIGGVYYQQSIGGAAGATPVRTAPSTKARLSYTSATSGVVMHEVDSADAIDMQDAGFADLLAELNRKNRQMKMSTLFAAALALIGAITCLELASSTYWSSIGAAAVGAALLATCIGWGAGRWLDSYKRVAVLAYDLDDRVTRAYECMASAFATLAACGRMFRVDAGGKVNDLTTWKRNAGASHLLKTEPITLDHHLPAIVRSNVMPPALRSGGRTFYFLPDLLLVLDRKGFGAVGYSDLHVQTQPSRWIEEGSLPRDAQVVGQTWQHPNKSGGPDRRFKQNRQLPICLHDVLHLASSSGMNELMQFSRPGCVAPFKASLEDLPQQAVMPSASGLLA